MKRFILLSLAALLLGACGTGRTERNDDEGITDAASYANILDYIEGRYPGVYVSDGCAYIRGSEVPAVFEVDGIMHDDADFLFPGDVYSIEVISGPSAAIYGIRGEYGVIKIVTKGSHQAKVAAREARRAERIAAREARRQNK